MRSLAQQKLSERQDQAIRGVLIDVLPRGRREEFRDACRLARAVNSPGFRKQLRRVMVNADADTQQRAQWMLDGCERAAPDVVDAGGGTRPPLCVLEHHRSSARCAP